MPAIVLNAMITSGESNYWYMFRYAFIFCTAPSALLTYGSSSKSSNNLCSAPLAIGILHALFFFSKSPLHHTSSLSPWRGTWVPSRVCGTTQVTLLWKFSRDSGGTLAQATSTTTLLISTRGSTRMLGSPKGTIMCFALKQVALLNLVSDVQGTSHHKMGAVIGVGQPEISLRAHSINEFLTPRRQDTRGQPHIIAPSKALHKSIVLITRQHMLSLDVWPCWFNKFPHVIRNIACNK